MSNKIFYNARQYEVDAVTLYRSDQAEVTRKIRVTLKSGTNVVEINNLPSTLDQDSIQVDGTGNATIVDVIYRQQRTRKADQEEDNVTSLSDQEKRLEAELSIVQRKLGIVEKYSTTVDGQNISTSQFESYLSTFTETCREIYETQFSLEKKLEKVSQELEDANSRSNAKGQDTGLYRSQITIVVTGERDSEAEFNLTYIVSNASWTPQYDLRASITSNQISPLKVKTIYRASIRQSTGEDWSNISLTLSTASPQRGAEIPDLKPEYILRTQQTTEKINISPRHGISGHKVEGTTRVNETLSKPPSELFADSDEDLGGRRFGQLSNFNAVAQKGRRKDVYNLAGTGADPGAETNIETALDGSGNTPGQLAGDRPLALRPTGSMEGEMSMTYAVPGLFSIPTSGDDTSQSHLVFLMEMETDEVELEWISVPRKVEEVFCQCKFQNKSEHIFLEGKANVFVNNKFVAKSSISNIYPQEYITCPLGVDPSLKITYLPQTIKVSSYVVVKGNGQVKMWRRSIEQVVLVKNNKKRRVERLIVRDQVPVCVDDVVRVTLLKPKELARRDDTDTGNASTAGMGVEHYTSLSTTVGPDLNEPETVNSSSATGTQMETLRREESLSSSKRGKCGKLRSLLGKRDPDSLKSKGGNNDGGLERKTEKRKEMKEKAVDAHIVSVRESSPSSSSSSTSSRSQASPTQEEPHEDAGDNSQAGVTISPRWFRRLDSSSHRAEKQDDALTGGALTNETGMLEWVCSLDPGANAELVLAWEVVAPDHVQWTQFQVQ